MNTRLRSIMDLCLPNQLPYPTAEEMREAHQWRFRFESMDSRVARSAFWFYAAPANEPQFGRQEQNEASRYVVHLDQFPQIDQNTESDAPPDQWYEILICLYVRVVGNICHTATHVPAFCRGISGRIRDITGF